VLPAAVQTHDSGVGGAGGRSAPCPCKNMRAAGRTAAAGVAVLDCRVVLQGAVVVDGALLGVLLSSAYEGDLAVHRGPRCLVLYCSLMLPAGCCWQLNLLTLEGARGPLLQSGCAQ
jgi:hypothetical protein